MLFLYVTRKDIQRITGLSVEVAVAVTRPVSSRWLTMMKFLLLTKRRTEAIHLLSWCDQSFRYMYIYGVSLYSLR